EGDIREYDIQVSDDGHEWHEAARGELLSTFAPQQISFPRTITVRRLKLTALSGFGPDKTTALAELAIIYAGPKLPDAGADALNYQRSKTATPDIDEGTVAPKQPTTPPPKRKPPPATVRSKKDGGGCELQQTRIIMFAFQANRLCAIATRGGVLMSKKIVRAKLLWSLLMISFVVCASSARAQAGAADQTIVLWPEGAPGALGHEPTDIPTLTPYLPPKERATGAAIIVCPGGGYTHLAEHEGRPVAEWLNTIGVTAFVLKYRLGPRYHHPAMLQDAARAIRTVRARAKE